MVIADNNSNYSGRWTNTKGTVVLLTGEFQNMTPEEDVWNLTQQNQIITEPIPSRSKMKQGQRI